MRHRAIATGVAAILLFDVVSLLVANFLKFPYQRVELVALIICMGIGAFVAQSAIRNPLREAAIAAGAAGFAHVLVGWVFSWKLGIGRPPIALDKPLNWIGFALVMVLLTAWTGACGGVLWRSSRARSVSSDPHRR